MTIQHINPNLPATAAAQTGTLARVDTETVRDLSAWATDMDAAYAIAKRICGTMFVPQHFRNKPDEAAAAILYGFTLDMPPMVSVKTIYVVHGTPALYAQQMYAIALSKGHEIERVFADNTRVEYRCRRRGAKDWQKVEWTIERAEQAKYTSNPKYRENPIGMLTEKCKAEASKLVAPDALAGMNSVEEIRLGDFEDLGEQPAQADAPAPAASKPITITRTIKSPAPAQPAPEPEPVADEATGEVMDDGPAAVLETDWDEEIAKAEGNRDALTELWSRAMSEGADAKIIDRIVEAGSKVAQQ